MTVIQISKNDRGKSQRRWPTKTETVEIDTVRIYKVNLLFMAAINVFAPAGATITCAGNGEMQSIVSTGQDTITVYEAGDYTVTRNKSGKTVERTVTISEAGTTTDLVLSMRYGYRKKKSEGSPTARIEYLYDAVDMAPAAMRFSESQFDYGDWGDVWFVTKNKPVMLKADGTEDYELSHSDHTQKLEGGASAVSDTNYDGNAMSAIPLCWFYRYEDTEYEYEIVCEHQWDDNYKAYAHTRADSTIADYFYWGMFGASGSASKLRSLKGKTLAQNLTTDNQIAGATANNKDGSSWYIHTWSQCECIRTLLVLMGKSTNTQAVFGKGNCRGTSGLLTTGTLSDKGQFWGSTANNQQVKVFYIERFWGDQWDRIAGLINNKGSIYYKMTPEDQGYRVTDVTGYTNSGITPGGTSGGYISATKCGEFGCIPTTFSGTENTFECDGGYYNNGQLDYLNVGGAADNATGFGGAFSFDVRTAPSHTYWTNGCGLSCEKPVEEG